MSDLRDLYQEVIFDHYKHPRNHHALAGANHVAHGHNRLCGDQITVYLQVADGVIRDLSFEGVGCAISTASASLMTDALKGKRLDEAGHLLEQARHMVMHDDEPAPELGKLEVLAGVREFPARVKCATLAWDTLQAALKECDQSPPAGDAAIADERPAQPPPIPNGASNMDPLMTAEPDQPSLSEDELRANIIATLRTIYDPEIHVNILDLGLIYRLDIDQQGNVAIDMTLTAPACPVAGAFPGIVEAAVSEVAGVHSVHVELVWEPAWSVDSMSDDVKLELGLL